MSSGASESLESGGPTPELLRLLDELVARCHRGEPVRAEELIASFPSLAGKIKEIVPACEMLEELRLAAMPAEPSRDGAPSFPGQSGERPRRLGEYRIVREIGRGGMGVVYEAEQVALGRRVALKVLPYHALLDPQHIERFQREARAAANLHHTNIVPVFGVGEVQGLHYYAMQLIEGRSLEKLIEEIRSTREVGGTAHALELLLSPSGSSGERPFRSSPGAAHGVFRSIARIGFQTAEALSYAHAEGIIHRDIKPANLILDGDARVWVSDFGLALTEDSERLTHTGDLAGTLRYLAPERLQGRCDHRVDIYALGLTLYELLTLEPAFPDRDRSRLLRSIAEAEPLQPRKLDPAIPVDLEKIVLKAIAKDPGQRYVSACAMADDLERFRIGEPVKARRVSGPVRLWRWCRRRPLVASLVGAVAMLLFAVAIVSSIAYVQTARARDDEAAQRQTAVGNLYHSLVRESRATRLGRQVGYRARVWALLDQARRLATPERDIAELRQEAVHCMADFVGLDPLELDPLPGVLSAVVGSSSLLVLGTKDGEIYALDVTMGSSPSRIGEHTAPISALHSDAAARLLVSADAEGMVKLWQRNGNGPWNPAGKLVTGDRIDNVAADPEARRIFVWRRGAEPRAWDLSTGNQAQHYDPGPRSCLSFAVQPDAKHVVAGFSTSTEDGILVWDATSGELIHRAAASLNGARSLAFSGDSKLMAAGYEGGIEVYDTERWERVAATRCTFVLWSAFHPESQLVGYRFSDFVRLWNVEANTEIAILGHALRAGRQWGGFVEAGKRLFAADTAGMRIWNLEGAVERLAFSGHANGIDTVVFSHKGDRIATAANQDGIGLWDVGTRQRLGRLQGLGGSVKTLDFSPDDKELAVGVYSGTLYLVSSVTLETKARLESPVGSIWAVEYSRDGELLGLAGDSGVAVLRLQGTGSQLLFRKAEGEICRDLSFSPDGRILAWVDNSDRPHVLDLVAGASPDIGLPVLRGPIRCLSFDPQGRLAFVTSEMRAEIWDPHTGAKVCTMGERGDFNNEILAFSPDGQLLAAKSPAVSVAVWDVATRRRLMTLPAERTDIWSLAWSPDGERIAVGLNDGGLYLWDLPRLRAELRTLDLDWDR